MKNLPDDELFKEIQDRLQHYDEQPDESDWDKIAANIPGKRGSWLNWSDAAGILGLLLFATSLFYGHHDVSSANTLDRSGIKLDVAVIKESNGMAGQTSNQREVKSQSSDEAGNLHGPKDVKTNRGDQTAADGATSKSPTRAKDNDLQREQTLQERPSASHARLKSEIRKNGNSENGKIDRDVFQHQTVGQKPSVSLRVRQSPSTPSEQLTTPELGDELQLKQVDEVVDGDQQHEVTDTSESSHLSKGIQPTVPLSTSKPTDASKPGDKSIDVLAKASDDEDERASRGKNGTLSLYALATPSLGYQHIEPKPHDDVVVISYSSPSVLSMQRLGFGLEAGIQKELGSRLSLLGGVTYYHHTTQFSFEQQTGNSVVEKQDALSFNIRPDTQSRSIRYTQDNLGFNTGLIYVLSFNRLAQSLGATVQYEFGRQHYSGNEVRSPTQSHFFNFQLLYRVEYAVNARTILFMQPSYTRSIVSSTNDNLPFDVKQTRAGLGFGVRYRLLK